MNKAAVRKLKFDSILSVCFAAALIGCATAPQSEEVAVAQANYDREPAAVRIPGQQKDGKAELNLRDGLYRLEGSKPKGINKCDNTVQVRWYGEGDEATFMLNESHVYTRLNGRETGPGNPTGFCTIENDKRTDANAFTSIVKEKCSSGTKTITTTITTDVRGFKFDVAILAVNTRNRATESSYFCRYRFVR